MRSYDCPQCGAAVAFQSSVTVFAVCGHCRSMVVRRDVNVELLGLQAELPPDLSPLQIGTRGEFDGQAFTLIGRVRIRYHEGSWNEWLANFGEDRWGWVAEAQGFYMVSFEVPVPDDFPGLVELRASATPDARTGIKLVNFGLSVGRENLPVGHELTLNGAKYSVRDSKQTEVISSEGELTFAATPGRAAISADLGGPGDAFANAEYSDDGIRLFVGRYCRFGELKLSELRPVPGWTAESFEPTRGQSSAMSCPNCGATVSLRAAGLSMAAVCGSCGSLIDTADPKLQLIDTAARRQVFNPVIPLGRRGTIQGTQFECIGFMRRRDQSGDAWFEYLLFNPFAGFRWLVTYQGHWSFVDQLLGQPDWSGGDVDFGGESYRLFATGRAEVSYVLGEFYWKVRVRERSEAADFIRPPFILSREAYPDLKEVTWSHGEYLAPAEVQAAFKLEEPLPEPRGAYLNQPNPHAAKGQSLRRWVPIFAVVLVIVQLVSAVRSANDVVYRNTLTLRTGETNQLELGKAFRVKGGVQPVEVSVYAPVDNSWVELELDLVNATNQRARSFTVPIEYYHGWDDGSWSEGSQRRSTLLTSVEPGDYFLAAELAAADSSITEIPVEITVTRDVPVWSNFWLGLVALLAYPSYRWLREHAFERARWAMSDYSPYTGPASDGDDDGNGIELGGDD